MGSEKASKQSRSFWRILFWEALGTAGWLYLTHHPLTGHPSTQHLFHLNALFFLAAYPLLFIYRWAAVEGFFNVLLKPLGWALSWALGVSAYFWLKYLFLTLQPVYFGVMTNHWILTAILFIFPYFLILQKFWGVSRLYYTMEECLALGLLTLLGGAAGFFLGKFAVDRLTGIPWLEGHRFLIWLLLAWLGVVLAAWIAQKKK
jgi:hypothetical protein